MTLQQRIDAIRSRFASAGRAEAIECPPEFVDTEASWWLPTQESTPRTGEPS